MKCIARFLPFLVSGALAAGCADTRLSGPLSTALSLDKTANNGKGSCGDSTTNRNRNAPVHLLCVITVPGKPILSGTKSWVDGDRYYLTDLSNARVDIIDAWTNMYLDSVPGFVGSAGNAATSGPNSIVFTGDGHAWVSDGISAVRVVDLSSKSFVTVPTAIAACDGGTATTHFCQRTNEITYDPEDQVIFVQNPSPLDTAAGHGAIDTYATFISAVPPYTVLGHITFANRRGQEAPLWDHELHRILSAVSGRTVTSGTPPVTTIFHQYIAVINPTTMQMENQYVLDCHELVGTAPGALFGINDPALGTAQRLVVPGCGHAILMDARTGAAVALTQIGGGNETWYNSGDGRFYVTGIDSTLTSPVNSLGVINAETGTFLQGVPALQATNPAAFAGNNHIFAVVTVTAAQVTNPATDNSACSVFGVRGK